MIKGKPILLSVLGLGVIFSISACTGPQDMQRQEPPAPQERQQTSTPQEQQQVPSTQTKETSVDISDAKMQEFVEVYNKITAISQKYSPELEQAKTQEETNQIMSQANAEMEEEIEKYNFSVEEYNQILATIQTEPELLEKFQKLNN